MLIRPIRNLLLYWIYFEDRTSGVQPATRTLFLSEVNESYIFVETEINQIKIELKVINMADLAIIIPAYKATYLYETLESIAKQTDKRFHLYIGDDCSPSDIESIIEEFKERVPLTYERFDSNLGGKDLVGQWERCIGLTKGEPYIWLFSDDDIMEPRCVENFYDWLDKYPENQLFHFNINMIDELNGGAIKSLPVFPRQISAGEFLEAKLRGRIVSYVVEFIFARNIYELVNGFQNYDLAWGADFITWLKMAAQSHNGILTIQGDECCVNWRKSSENISPNNSNYILVRKIQSLIRMANYIKNELTYSASKFKPLKKSFRWIRFPLGSIYRNRKNLSFSDINMLCRQFYKEVGYPIPTFLCYVRTCLFK